MIVRASGCDALAVAFRITAEYVFVFDSISRMKSSVMALMARFCTIGGQTILSVGGGQRILAVQIRLPGQAELPVLHFLGNLFAIVIASSPAHEHKEELYENESACGSTRSGSHVGTDDHGSVRARLS